MRLLAADIGGTKTLLAIIEVDGDAWHTVREQRYEATAFDDFDTLLTTFISADGGRDATIDRGCIAVAGPLSADGQRARVTNLDWELDTASLSVIAGAPLTLINDFAAVGHGIDRLDSRDLVMLQSGQPQRHAPRVVVGAGTGLGVGQQVWQGDHYAVMASEGGHVDFAPIGALQRELLAWMEQRLGGHVSVERLVSGPGLVTLHEFLCALDPSRIGLAPEQVMAAEDPAATIAMAAETDALAARALDLFVSIYGAHAGNLALITLPRAGLYIAGGIAPKLIDHLRDGRFLAAFNDKGRMSHLTAAMPVAVIMNQKVGLLGAMRVAVETLPRR